MVTTVVVFVAETRFHWKSEVGDPRGQGRAGEGEGRGSVNNDMEERIRWQRGVGAVLPDKSRATGPTFPTCRGRAAHALWAPEAAESNTFVSTRRRCDATTTGGWGCGLGPPRGGTRGRHGRGS